tara:strand:- start:4763 stop:5164 length:402 start_codon:yes stop_codon:yes gene_type:complete
MGYMNLEEKLPLMIYDDRCYVCIKFAKFVNFFAKGRLRMIGHYTDFGKSIRENYLGQNALEMFWFIDKNTAYGGRAALRPLITSILRHNYYNSKIISIQESCDIGCKDSLAVFFRSASLITHSKKITITKQKN